MISPWLHCYWSWSVWAATPTRETGFGIQSTTVLDCGCECPSRLNLLISPLTWRTALVTLVALRMVGCSFDSIQLLLSHLWLEEAIGTAFQFALTVARGRTARWFCLRRPVLEVLVAHCTLAKTWLASKRWHSREPPLALPTGWSGWWLL
jgi:hypothetical protein